MQSIGATSESRYRGITHGLTTMWRSEGVLRPYRGMTAVMAGAGPAHGFYYASYEHLKRFFSVSTDVRYNMTAHLCAGGIATTFHDAIMVPAEVVKQRMQVQGSSYTSNVHCMFYTYQKEGFRAFYRSFPTQLMMNIPFSAVHFAIYEVMLNLTNPERTYNVISHLVSGGIAGGVAAGLTNPLDVCKTLLNTQESKALLKSQQEQINGLVKAAKTIFRLQGTRGFFHGVSARVINQIPSTAISWTIYEFFKHILLEQRNSAYS